MGRGEPGATFKNYGTTNMAPTITNCSTQGRTHEEGSRVSAEGHTPRYDRSSTAAWTKASLVWGKKVLVPIAGLQSHMPLKQDKGVTLKYVW